MHTDTGQKHYSLLNTLLTRLIITSLGAAILVFCVLFYNLSSTHNSLLDRGLISQANDIKSHIKTNKSGKLQFQLPEEMSIIYRDKKKDVAYDILDAKGRVLYSSTGLETPLYPVDLKDGSMRPEYFRFTNTETGGKVTGVSIFFELSSKLYLVQVTQGAYHEDVLVDSIIEEFTESTASMIFLLVLCVLIINVVTIRKAMMPLQSASKLAKDINPAMLNVRLPETQLPQEILPFVQAINAALERLEKGFHIQRDFTADAAHQLRTPLSILSARIDTLSNEQEYPALKSNIQAMNRIVGQLLKVAQLEVLVVDKTAQADLSAICINVATELGPLAIKQDKSISVFGATSPVMINGNSESLHHAILNLTENALKHTPCKTDVEIEVNTDKSIRVRDYGQGISPENHTQAFKRFWRADKDNSGAGLGLAIVARIVEVHQGTVHITQNAPNSEDNYGCEVVINFP